ncbi:MAG TPA: fumarylacetoacetate hydrolase family protein [Steroidobacter sp.]
MLGIRSLQRLATLDVDALPVVNGEPRIAPPVAAVGKFIAIGLNYSDHAAETNMPIPRQPIVFSKATSCIVGAYDDVHLPRGSTKTDWEVELGVIIGTTASYVSEAEALKYVAGYCVVNDLSEGEYQLERGGSWDKGKGLRYIRQAGRRSSAVSHATSRSFSGPRSGESVTSARSQTGNTRVSSVDIRVERGACL